MINRNYNNLILSYCMHLFGLLIAIGGYLIVNIIGISLYNDNCSALSNIVCYNSDVIAISYIMFFIGFICLVLIVTYLILMPCYIMDILNQRNIYLKQNNNKIIDQTHDYLSLSSLYAQSSLNPDGSLKTQNIVSVQSSMYEYPIGRF